MSSLSATAKLGTGKRLAPPSPSPSNASSNGTPSKRQKREGGIASKMNASPTPAALAAAEKSFGNEMMTSLTYAIDYLKAKGQAKSIQDILEHLSMHNLHESQKVQIVSILRKHSRITYNPTPKHKDQPKWMAGSYEYRPAIPGVKSKVTLLSHLQAKTDCSNVSVKDLKDGWPDCDKAIDELEAEHKIVVVRTRKDNHARFIWIDSPPLNHAVDPEFVAMWHKVPIPSTDDIVRKLQAVGQKPASEDPRLKKVETVKTNKQKKRVNRSSKNQQNEHMKHLLQDYSHMKR